MHSLFLLLLRRSSASVILIIVIGSIAGLCNSSLLALISEALRDRASVTTMMIAAFLALSLGVMASNLLPELLLSRLSRSLAAELRLRIGRRVLAAPLRHLETLGHGPVLAVLTHDLQTVVATATALPSLVVGSTIVLGCLVYMAWLSLQGLLLVLPAMAVLAGIYAVGARKMAPLWRAERDAQDELYRQQQHVLEGVKELKLHERRRSEFFEHDFAPAVEGVRRTGVRASDSVATFGNFLHFFTWLVLGLVLFGLNLMNPDGTSATQGYVMTLMYMWGSFRGLIESIGRWAQAGIALEKLSQLDVSLTEALKDEAALGSGLEPARSERHEVRFSGVTYSFGGQDGHAFRVGPLDLELRPGELIFVVGGNGSGKTTLAKLLTGLYAPETGQLLWNGVAVTDENREAYRNTFSAIFADFHLFEHLRGVPSEGLTKQAEEYLRRLSLEKKLQIVDGRFSTTNLSTGQRKRLAMLVALLEDRPFYLFDEWAADQDPEFREIFYRQLLPELAARGKGVVVITHDDRFFHLAHRVIKLEYGRLVAAA
ncbi:cyclic peptide export ABC transporter [Pyxidicoccus fallax]|uniref:Cyclic peptide export ABC transporter n=1 Tax=Pyxidicoccus fallax TaxID=394095 RepID=A0A848LK37_9BACT|nr:cyclic peptide export ABC transporter [Pyxidicoccus fallax]NMO18063.1 cyclic peptide export ABC transporter [Pyxidicoccus fallax]NPC83084.1 cyclic peptide export ABC transporter [Pyxidicoccus fallax]